MQARACPGRGREHAFFYSNDGGQVSGQVPIDDLVMRSGDRGGKLGGGGIGPIQGGGTLPRAMRTNDGDLINAWARQLALRRAELVTTQGVDAAKGEITMGVGAGVGDKGNRSILQRLVSEKYTPRHLDGGINTSVAAPGMQRQPTETKKQDADTMHDGRFSNPGSLKLSSADEIVVQIRKERGMQTNGTGESARRYRR